MKKGRVIRYMVEYCALRLVHGVLNAIPLTLALCGARALARVAYVCSRTRRTIAKQNIMRAGIADNARDASRIVRASFRHFGEMAVECVHARKFFKHHDIAECVRLEADAETRFLIEDPSQGAIITTAHVGNWEIGALRIGMLKPLLSVARKMNNPYVNRFIDERTHRAHMRVVPKRSGARSPLITTLKNGEAVAILGDQHARVKGMMIDFFGVPASTETSAARLHLATGAPILPVFCMRHGRMRYTLTAGPPISCELTSDREQDIKSILTALNDRIESVIRAHPEQYLWVHRRWRKTPGQP